MQALTELIPPTAVTHAVSLSFLGRETVNLVIAKTSLLQIFEVRSVRSECADEPKQKSIDSSLATNRKSRLSLVGEYQLAGTVTSLAAVKLSRSRSGGLALLVSFKDAKVSLVEWDPATHNLSTVSIHFYEGDEAHKSPFTPNLTQCRSFLTVDPSSRCAALKYGHRHLALLPFQQQGSDVIIDETVYDSIGTRNKSINQPSAANGTSEKPPAPYSASFVLPLTALDSSLIVPIDLVFLHEYREPTIGILSSPKYPSSGLSIARKDSFAYTVYALDLEEHARTPLISITNLPSDLFKLVPLPLPVGGTLLVGGNEVIHVDQAGKMHAVGTNSFAQQSSSFPMFDQSNLELKMEGCIIVPIEQGSSEMLMILNTGDFAILTFKMDGRSVSGLSVQLVPVPSEGSLLGGPASCALLLPNDDIFIGTPDSSSLLIHCEKRKPQPSKKRSYADMADGEELSEEDIEDVEDLLQLDGTGDAQSIHAGDSNSLGELVFSIQDELPCMAPMRQVVVSQQRFPAGLAEAKSPNLTLAAPIGRGRAGGVAVLTRALRPSVGQPFDFIENATGVWSVKPSRQPLQPTDESTAVVNTDVSPNELLIVTTVSAEGEEASSIYSITADGLKPCVGTNFDEDTPTLDVGVLRFGTRIVQVARTQLNCYDSGKSIIPIRCPLVMHSVPPFSIGQHYLVKNGLGSVRAGVR